MGNQCLHKERILVRVLGDQRGSLYSSRYADYKCSDCEQFDRIESLYISSPDMPFMEIVHSPDRIWCPHKVFFIISEIQKEFFTSGLPSDINLGDGKRILCNVSIAECAECTERFQVRCGFKELDGELSPSENWEII